MIGIFDSGLGGLTVAKSIKKVLSGFDFIYFGDTARVPYGNKSPELIKQYSLNNAKFLISKGAKVIVVACNSASAVALEYLRNNLDIPVFGVIDPAVNQAINITNGRIGVMGTRLTVNSKVFQKKIANFKSKENILEDNDVNIPAFMRKGIKNNKNNKINIKVFAQAAPLLVPLIEEGFLNKPETKKILKRYLYPLKQEKIDTLILGCTHYPLLKDMIQEKMKQVHLINSADAVAYDLKDYFAQNTDLQRSLSKRKHAEFYVSDLTPHLTKVAENFMGMKINFELVEV